MLADRESHQMYLIKPQPAPRVLIADDDPVIRRWLTSILKNEGYEVIAVSDGREVYRLLQSDADFKAAVLDLAMPFLDGPDLIRHMRSEKRLMRIPVMMITAESQIKLLASGLAAGATVLLTKPFTRAQLQRTLSMMIGTRPERAGSSLPTTNRKALSASVSPQTEPSATTVSTPIEERTPTAAGDNPIDFQVLRELDNGDDKEASSLITELIDLYLESAQREVEAIKTAALNHDEVSIKQRAHALKGSSSTIGARRITRLCEQLEALSGPGVSERADHFAKELGREFKAARAALVAERAQGMHASAFTPGAGEARLRHGKESP
jgi:CheY-like chemotaxis protein/HPt (histidine-containing phosphotransfer) domain-containing protein